MPYFIETWDKDGWEKIRAEHRQAHVGYLEANNHLLLACGAKLNDDGSGAGGGVYIVDTETREEAEGFIAGDPFSKADLFKNVSIVRWRKAFLDGKCYLK